VKRRLIAVVIVALAPLGLIAHGARADDRWACVAVEPPVDVTYCQHNVYNYLPLNQVPKAPAPPTPATPPAPKV
jgi:hypothetical protein